MRATRFLIGLVFLFQVGAASAANIHSEQFTWTDPSSNGQVDILVQVADNGLTQDWTYTLTNLSYDPAAPLSNGLSGFNLIFAAPVAELSNVFGPAGWFNNCCGTPPPLGSEWDINNVTGFGIPIGGSDVFGFTTDRREIVLVDGVAPGITSWMHSWVNNTQTPQFTGDIIVPGDLNPIPEPAGLALFAVGCLIVQGAVRRRRA
jgi:hypothetical protein